MAGRHIQGGLPARGPGPDSKRHPASAFDGRERAWARVGIAVLLAALASTSVAGTTRPPKEASRPQLVAVRQQIHTLEERLRTIQQRQSDLVTTRDRLETELALATARLRESQAQRDQAVEAEKEAEARAKQAEARLVTAAGRLKAQITLLAVLGRAGLMPLVLQALPSGQDLPERVTVLRALVREQKRQRDEVAALVEQRTAAVAELSEQRQALDTATGEVDQRRRDLEATRARVTAELATLERQRREGAVALADAQENEARLERLWGTVVGRDDEVGGDVRLLRGGLPWPLSDAHVVRRFGPHRDPQYGTVTTSHGLLLAAPAGEKVLAVARGTVVYASFFKAYGNLVIVNHGRQVYSLYARLSSMLVSAGQRVGMGQPLGLLGPEERGSGNFYFEIRVGDTAQNPLGWLKPGAR